MTQIKALRNFALHGEHVDANTVIPVTEDEASALVLMGKAILAPDIDVKKPRKPRTKADPASEPAGDNETDDATPDEADGAGEADGTSAGE